MQEAEEECERPKWPKAGKKGYPGLFSWLIARLLCVLAEKTQGAEDAEIGEIYSDAGNCPLLVAGTRRTDD